MPQTIRDVMTSNPCTIDAERSVAYAAKMMREEDVGLAPIVEDDKLIGLLTDRDIATRLVAEGRDPDQVKVRDVASKRKEATVLVLELDGKVVGTVAIWAPGSPQSEAWLPQAWDLRHLAFDPAVHGRGLSAPLLDRAEQIARDSGARYMCLHVRRGNKGVAKLYMGRGYERDPKGDLELPEVSLDAYFLRLR